MRRAVAVALVSGLALPALAADPVALTLTLQDHRFTPAELLAPAGQPIVITVLNHDPSAEEFESESLKVEKVVAAGRQIIVRLRPLEPGRYGFIGEYNKDSAQGVLVVE